MTHTPEKRKTLIKISIQVLGVFLLPLIWFVLKDVVQISDRYLPSFAKVLNSFTDIEPSIIWHFIYTISRFVLGFLLGTSIGIALGLMVAKYLRLFDLLMPSIQATRAVPAIAIVPFFLLWFGFSEMGKYLLVVVGTAFNIAVATYQIVKSTPEKHLIMFRSFGVKPEDLVFTYGLPRVAEQILPTLRFSLSTAIGLIIVSELLGSQIGLGYLIQTARSNYATHVIFLVMILLGILNVTADWILRYSWSKIVYWR